MKPHTTLLTLIVGALLATLGVAAGACGGGGGGGTLTVEEYFDRIDEIDAASAERSDSIEADFDQQFESVEDEGEQIALFVDGFDAIFDEFEDLGSELAGVNPPDEVETSHDEAVASIEGAVSAYRDLRDEFAASQDLLEVTDLFLSDDFDTAQQRAVDACLALETLSEELNSPVDLDCNE